jgi:hypothetical protein
VCPYYFLQESPKIARRKRREIILGLLKIAAMIQKVNQRNPSTRKGSTVIDRTVIDTAWTTDKRDIHLYR